MRFLIALFVLCTTSCVTSRTYVSDIIYLNVSANANEKEWMNALAKQLNGKTEQQINMGRVDIVTEKEAIEIDWLYKWHEGLGQALHYSIETKKQPTLALISLSTNDTVKLDYIRGICGKLGIRLAVLRNNQ